VTRRQIQAPPITRTPVVTRPRSSFPQLGWGLPLLVAGIVAGLRLYRAGPAYDLFVDEMVYRDLGLSVYSGGFARLPGSHLFFLHPPGFFYVEAAWMHLVGRPSALFPALYSLRELNALAAGATGALLVLLGRYLHSVGAGLVAATLFALEPYALRQNGRVLLETVAMDWVLLGYLLLLVASRRTGAAATRMAVAAGLCFGLAVLSKDYLAIVTLLPLAALGWTGWLLTRRAAVWATVMTAAPYYLYFLVSLQQRHAEQLVGSKTTGIQRLLGIVKTTGFKHTGAPSLTSTLAAQALTFGGTYVLLAVGAVLALLLLRADRPELRLQGLFHVSAGLLLAYSVTLGTLEEQFLYLLIVPTLLTVGIWLVRLLSSRSTVAAALGVLLVAVVVLDARSYLQVRTSRDDGYARLLGYLRAHVPGGTAIAVLDGTAELMLRGQYDGGPWGSPQARADHGARYLIVPVKEARQGYSYAPPADIFGPDGYLTGGTLVFSAPGRTHEAVQLYRFPGPDARS